KPWYPGHYETLSDPGGRFAFDALPPGPLFVGVTPGEWLQIQPELHTGLPGVHDHDLTPGEVLEVGVLQVAARHVVTVHVVDRAGEPAVGAEVLFSPQEFAGGLLLTAEGWEQRFEPDVHDELELERLAREGEGFFAWQFGPTDQVADVHGDVEFVGVPGTWLVEVQPPLGRESVQALIQLPAQEVTITLPTILTRLRGKVSSVGTDRGVSGARLTIRRSGAQESARANSRGEFIFPALVLSDGCELRVADSEHFAYSRQLSGSEGAIHVELRPSYSLGAQIVDLQGRPISKAAVRLVRRIGGTPADVRGAEDSAWLAKLSTPISSTSTGGVGIFSFLHLLGGTYALEMLLTVPSGEEDLFGNAIGESVVWKKWELMTGQERRVLQVDLAGYKPLAVTEQVTLMGTVLSESDNRALIGARVEIARGGETRSLLTDANGSYSCQIPRGRAQLSVSTPGYESYHQRERHYISGSYVRQLRLKKTSDQ
ncbi:MAG: hypothetical protein ACI9F9_000496, partial [Candidatus Paceibacteria bacterium]